MLRRILLPLLVAGCATSTPSTMNVLEYNVGLAVGFVPAADERANDSLAAAVAVGADVVCLQEVWEPRHVEAAKAAAGSTYPHTFFPEAQQEIGSDPGCTNDDLDSLLSCIDSNCSDVCDDELPDCLFANCAIPFLGLPDDCNRCVQANVGSTPEEIRNTCTTELTEYAYGGSFGTGILSKYKIKSTEETVFASTTNRRSLLHAVLETPSGDVDVFCTHLTAVFSLIPYPREEGSWAEEQKAQVEELVAKVNSAATNSRVVVMGDMNNGPQVGTSPAEFPEHYALFAGMGMSNPYVDATGPCTFCNDNNLSSADSDDENRVIDHVFVKGLNEVKASRVLDQATTSSTCGTEIPAHHSDHYGVYVEAKL